MTTFDPVSVTRLYRVIANQIIERITQGDFVPGSRLPSERELAEQLQVSRTSVREALIALEMEGRVEVRVGSGVYVRDGAAGGASLSGRLNPSVDIQASGTHPAHKDVGAFELLQVQLMIEPEAAAMAANHATEEQLAAIEAAARAMEGSDTPRLFNRLFHLAIGEASGNAAMALTVRNLWDIHDESVMFNKLEQHIVTRAAWDCAEHEHNEVVDAILSRDPIEAKRAMREHIIETRRRLRQDFQSGM
jgi:DNA-binding FadR family transcriptional regulator